MNAVMLSFILLATMFVASGISNVVSVTNGIDSYLDKAGIGDYVVISMGTDSGAALDEMLRTEEKVIEYRTEPVIWGDKSISRMWTEKNWRLRTRWSTRP